MWDGTFDSLSIWFDWDNLPPPSGLGPFGHIFNMSDILSNALCSVHIFYI